MATTKVGIYRSFYGPVPTDSHGQPLPRSEWPKKRPFSWVVRWFGADGNRYSRSFETRKEAERFAEDKQNDVREAKADPPPPITLRAYFKEHRMLMKDALAPATLHIHLVAMDLLAASVGWDRPLARISAKEIEHFRAERLATGITAASANREMRALKRIFNLAATRGYIVRDANPCLPLKMLKVGRKRPPYCSAEEFQTLLRGVKAPILRALLVTIYTTGLRLKEAENLTWADIDLATGQVHVTRKTADGWVQAWRPNDYEMRTVPLPGQAGELLAALREVAPAECPYVFMEAGRWDFYREHVAAKQWRSGQELVNNLLRRLMTVCHRAGVGPYTFHDLRRSCITNWAQHLPIHVVQQLAGHSDIKTTQQYYLAVRPEDVAKAQEIQSALLGTIPAGVPTDQKLTNSGRIRAFPGRKVPAKRFQTL